MATGHGEVPCARTDDAGRSLGRQAVEKRNGEGAGGRSGASGEGSGVQQSGVNARRRGGIKSSL